MKKPLVGLLALQGDFQEHRETLHRLGIPTRDIRLPRDLIGIDGLIFPGGESTTILKLLRIYDLYEPVVLMGKKGLPVYGTCAGAIVLAREADRLDNPTLGLIDISVHRNAYGRQVDSFEEELNFPLVSRTVPGIFIRAPLITRTGPEVEVLIRSQAGDPVMVRENNILVSTFHPELSRSGIIHRYFIDSMVSSYIQLESGKF